MDIQLFDCPVYLTRKGRGFEPNSDSNRKKGSGSRSYFRTRMKLGSLLDLHIQTQGLEPDPFVILCPFHANQP